MGSWRTPAGLTGTSGAYPRISLDPEYTGFSAPGAHSTTDCRRRERPLTDDIGDVSGSETSKVPISTLGMDEGPMASQGRAVGEHRRGMWPEGAGRPSPQKPIVDISDERGNAAVRPLSVGAAEFSPTLGPWNRGTAEMHSDGGNSPSYSLDSRRRMGRSRVVVPSAAEAGTVALSSVAGTIAPVDFSRISVPAVAAMKFSVVAEVLSSAVDVDDDTLFVRASEQRSDVSLDPRTASGIVDRPMAGISVPEPLEYSVLDVDLDGRPMEGISVPEPLEHSVLDVDLDGRHMEGILVPEPLEHSVLDVDLDGRPMEGISFPEPLKHSVLDVDLDSGPMKGISALEPLEYSVLDVALERKSMEGMSALEPLEHSVLEVTPDGRPAWGISVMEPLEHSVPDVARYGVLVRSSR